MSYDAITSGFPSTGPFSAGASTVTSGIDTNSLAEWVNVGKGFVPVSAAFAKSVQLAATANATSVVVKAPASGLYRIDVYEFPTVIASNNDGVLPAANVAFTEADTAGSITGQVVVADVTSLTTAAANEGSTIINAKVGTSITVSFASYAAGTGTGVTTYNAKTRITFLG